jgi:hypothetical protein
MVRLQALLHRRYSAFSPACLLPSLLNQSKLTWLAANPLRVPQRTRSTRSNLQKHNTTPGSLQQHLWCWQQCSELAIWL